MSMRKLMRGIAAAGVMSMGTMCGTIALGGCSDGEKTKAQQKVETLAFTQDKITLEEGDSKNLTPLLLIEPEGIADTLTLEWKSADEVVATVTKSGRVEALYEGKTTISAQASGKTTSITVEVEAVRITDFEVEESADVVVNVPSPLGISVTPARASVGHLKLTAEPNTGAFTFDGRAWNFNAKEAGTYTITVKYGDKTKTITAVAKEVAVEALTLSRTSFVTRIGTTGTLTATVKPENATHREVTWTSSNSGIATIDNNGNWKAVSLGNATFTAKTHNGITATCAIEVSDSDPLEAFDLAEEGKTITLGAQEKYTATVQNIKPTTASKNAIEWTSSDTSIATVENGVITAGSKTGTVTITAKAGNLQKTFSVKVSTIEVTSISFVNKPTDGAVLLPGKTYTFDIKVGPANATNKKINITSSPSALKVSCTQNGTGTETITFSLPEISWEPAINKYTIEATAEDGTASDVLKFAVPDVADITGAHTTYSSTGKATYGGAGTFGMPGMNPSDDIVSWLKSSVTFLGTNVDNQLTEHKDKAVFKSGDTYYYGYAETKDKPSVQFEGRYRITDYKGQSMTLTVPFRFTTSNTLYYFLTGRMQYNLKAENNFGVVISSEKTSLDLNINAEYYNSHDGTTIKSTKVAVLSMKPNSADAVALISGGKTGPTFTVVWK